MSELAGTKTQPLVKTQALDPKVTHGFTFSSTRIHLFETSLDATARKVGLLARRF